MWNKIMKEVEAKRVAGPFRKIPYKYFVQSPIGLVPKGNEMETHLIFHLSYDFKTSGYKSINFYTPQESCTVSYNDLDHAVRSIFRWAGEHKLVVFSKTDVCLAFCLLPLSPKVYFLLIMKCMDPETKETQFFRWFKFTLKPPYSGAHEHSLLAIWDTSHWNFFIKFGLRTAWDISYDILLSLLKFVNFWQLQGRLSILAKIGCLQKIKVFLMKERRGFNVTWGF